MIAVVGAGSVGCVFAAYLSTIKQKRVILYHDGNHKGHVPFIQLDQFKVSGALNFCSQPFEITTDIGYACSSKVIFICLPSFAQYEIYESFSSYLTIDHKVVFITGNFAALRIATEYRGIDIPKLAEVSVSPFACRIIDGHAVILGVKKCCHFGVFGQWQKNEITEVIKLFPCELHHCNNILAVGLQNMNGLCHPASMIFNAARIDNGEQFYYSREGVSTMIARYIEQIDKERLTICQALGISSGSFLEIMAAYYGEEFNTVGEFFKCNTVLNKSKICPSMLNHRYLTEDVPFVLVPWLKMAERFKINVPYLKNLVNMASLLLNQNFYNLGFEPSNCLD